MPAEAVQPLRINKTTPMSSPTKPNGTAVQRPLSEIGPMERRRNSPSYNQATKKMMLSRDSSPFDSSPFSSNSPRAFWQVRDPASPSRFGSENNPERDHSPSPKRSSIENLKKASRVKNSNMFAREQKYEYDPDSIPVVERPLAAGRPLSVQLQGNAYGGQGLSGFRKSNSEFKGHRRGESQTKIPFMSPTKAPVEVNVQVDVAVSPPKEQLSPTKSSLTTNGRYSVAPQGFDLEQGVWSEDEEIRASTPRTLRRLAKSVTFDAAPPQVNEYEMVTPDPSSVASGSREGSYDSTGDFDEDNSFDRGSSMDKDDSFDASLEDTDKTPVVLPGDWRHMSPDNADTSLADTFEDPFDGPTGSPMPKTDPSIHNEKRPNFVRAESYTSDGEARPLPPLPGAPQSASGQGRRRSSSGLSATAERISSAQRSLPSPPRAAAISKSDILSMRDPSISLEDRLRLMGIQDSPGRTRSLRDKKESLNSKKADDPGFKVHEDAVENGDEPRLDEYMVPRISRESILRRVKSRNFDDGDDDLATIHSSPERSYGDLDPDVPIPSREASSNFDADVPDVPIKQENDRNEVDVYAIPDMYSVERSLSRMDDYNREGSVIRHDVNKHQSEETSDDDASHYSADQVTDDAQQAHSSSTTEDEGPPTPKAADFGQVESYEVGKQKKKEQDMALPEFSSFLDPEDFNLGLQSYLNQSATALPTPTLTESAPNLAAVREFLQRPVTPEESMHPPPSAGSDTQDEPGTPDSVVHHPVAIEPPERDSPAIAEPVATVRAPGGKLKTRPSITPTDMASLAAARRQVSGEHYPPASARGGSRPSSIEGADSVSGGTMREANGEIITGVDGAQPQRKSSLQKLDIPLGDLSDDLSFGLDKEFERVIEQQKKGYLMRQNTKVVIASSRQFSDENVSGDGSATAARGTRSAGSSPRKPSHDRSQTWTTEPWNGKVRRKSVRQSSGGSGRKPPSGPAPPLPGQESNVNGLGTLIEDQMMANGDEPEDGTERGRLFVKVIGVKDLDLPLPKNERTWFQLTLDNGLHCVTTAWLELNRNAPIGQEFELVVLNDLEFQLTLQTKLTPPPKPTVPTVAPVKAVKPQKSSTFSRLLSSPKKRREAERKQQEELERAAQRQQEELQAKRASTQPTAWDLLHELVASDGSFARAYVCLKNHEQDAFGRPFTVDVPCFNEWALEDAAVASSVKSKRGGVVRRPPYKVGKLTLQLLYVPKPKGAKDEDMPKSMNACIRELKEAEESAERVWEGHLSQQGGDCPYWRRRFFRLTGTKLTAFHEATRQPRCTMNLAKASKLIDDRSTLMQPHAPAKSGKSRRKSAFAEEEEGYMFVEEGFRIRFANGETIDFYADNAAQKEGWMRVLSEVVGKDCGAGVGGAKAWTELVLARERARGTQKEKPAARPPAPAPPRAGSRSVPSSPVKAGREMQQQQQHGPVPSSVEKDQRHASPRGQQRREQVRSMIF